MAEIKRTIPGFTRRDNTLSRVVRDVPERKIEFEIGDATRPDFVPQAKTKWFDNEYNVSVRAKEHAEAVVRTRGNKVYYETPEYTVIQYDTPAGEEGGHELEWELPSKPDSNILPFTLRYKGDVRFYHQPALTQEEIDEGADRPENVVDSYAVYIEKRNHRKGGNNYATGKIQHVYRPKAIDAKGNEAWCTLHIPSNGQAETNIDCSVEVPQEFLDNAAYPVLVDPTFGNTSVGGSNNPNGPDIDNIIIGYDNGGTGDYNAPVNGTLTHINYYSKAAGTIRPVVYGAYNSGSNNFPLVTYGDEATSAVNDWVVMPVPYTSITSGNTYSMGVWSNTNNIGWHWDTATGDFIDPLTAATYHSNNAPPDPLSGGLTFNDDWLSIYATYTNYILTADAGSFTLSGTAAALEAGRYLAANAGSYTLTGQDVTFVVDRVLTAESGSFSLTGTDATLTYSGTTYTLTADPGSYTLTGTDAALEAGRLLAASPGSYTLTGQDATLTRDAVLTAASGSYTLTGTAAALNAGRKLTAESGSYTLSGTDASLIADRVLTAASGSFVLTGTDASLNYVTGYLLTAESGSFTLTGSDVTFTRSTRIFYNLDTGKLMYKVTSNYLIDL